MKKLLTVLADLALVLCAAACHKAAPVSALDYPSKNPNWRMVVDTNYPSCVPVDHDVTIHTTQQGLKYVRTPDARFTNLPGYPFPPNYVLIDGLRMHYVDEGPKNGEVVLMLHGQPSWSYLYRKMVPIFAKAGYRAIALDLIGTGRSDKPIDPGIHTYEQHIQWVKAFIQELKLTDITLFSQDWGGLIGLRVAGDDPGRFARLIAANTTLPIIPKGENPFYVPNPVAVDCKTPHSFVMAMLPSLLEKYPHSFQRWINYCLKTPNMEPSQVINITTVTRLTPEVKAAYDAPYPSMIYKAAPRSFPSMMAALEENNTRAWENLAKFDRPFLSYAGVKDKLLGTQAVQDKLTRHIPGSKGQPHERFMANHFIQEDVGELMAEKIVVFMKKNPINTKLHSKGY